MDLRNYSYLILTFVLCLVVQISFSSTEYEEKLKQIQKFNLGKHSWKAEPNMFTGKSLKQLKAYCGVPTKDSKPIKSSKKHRAKVLRSIPDSFDARDQWPDCTTISCVKDQSNCESCWAVSVASAFSDRLCISTSGQVNQNMSAEHLLSCCGECTGYDSRGGCASGGWPHIAWKYIEETGIPSGGDYNSNDGCQPYEVKPCVSNCYDNAPTPECHEDSCTNSDYDGSYKDSVRYGKSYYKLDSNEDIQSDIYNYGSVTTHFNVYEDFTQYKNGVYSHSWGKLVGAHAVRVIGWGHDEESGLDYWLVANSYGRGWGEDGHFRIRRGNNDCKFEDNFYAGLPYDSS